MDVLGRKKFPAALLEPTFASARLTLRAVPISTRVVGDGAMSAASALSVSAYEGARLSAGLLAGRLPCKRSRPPWCQSAYHRYASGSLETAMRLACAVIRASPNPVPRAVLASRQHPVLC